MKKEELLGYFNSFLEDIRIANDCISVLKSIGECTKNYLKEMNSSPAFFTIVQDSLLRTVFVQTAKIFDSENDGKNISFLTLLKLSDDNKNLFPLQKDSTYPCEWINLDGEVIEETTERETYQVNVQETLDGIRNKYKTFGGNITNIKQRRNKYYAHSDKKYYFDLNQLNSDTPITYKDFMELLEFASESINSLKSLLDNSVYSTHSLNCDDLENLLSKFSLVRHNLEYLSTTKGEYIKNFCTRLGD